MSSKAVSELWAVKEKQLTSISSNKGVRHSQNKHDFFCVLRMPRIAKSAAGYNVQCRTNTYILVVRIGLRLTIIQEFLNDTLQRMDAITSKITKPSNSTLIRSILGDASEQLTSNPTNNGIISNTHRAIVSDVHIDRSSHSSTLAELEGLLSYAKQLVNNIQTCAEHQALITNNVLDLSRLDAGKVEPVFDVVDVRALGYQSVSMMNSKAHSKAIHLRMSDAASEPLYLKADATLLSQVLLNLISNAIKVGDSSIPQSAFHSLKRVDY